MISEVIKEVKNTVKHWYIPLIVGALFIGLGLWTMFKPLESYIGLSLLFTTAFIISGIIEIYFAIANKNELDHWGWELTNGVLSLAIGIIMLLNPALSETTLPFYIGFVIMFRSVLAMSSSLEMKKYGLLDWGNLMAIGILGFIFSFILLWNPMFAGLTIVMWTGIAMITVGGYSVLFSIKLKKLHKLSEKVKDLTK